MPKSTLAPAKALEVLPAHGCAGSRKDGAPCRHRGVGEDGWCPVHRPGAGQDLVELGRAGGLASGAVRREQAKSVRDRLRERVEERFEEVWSAFEDGLSALTDGEPDARTRLAAATALLSEAYGKPAVAITGDADRPLSFIVQSAFAAAGEDE